MDHVSVRVSGAAAAISSPAAAKQSSLHANASTLAFRTVMEVTPEQIAAAIAASPVSATISMYGVERNNLTIHQHSRRTGRHVNAFSQKRSYLEYQLTLSFATITSSYPVVGCVNDSDYLYRQTA
jgi:hypothetical protein